MLLFKKKFLPAIRSGENTVQIIPPRGELLTGLVRFDTFVTGETPTDVVFSLNGKPILSKRSPPWSVELDMGHLPRTHRLRVASRNARGEELNGNGWASVPTVAKAIIETGAAYARITKPSPLGSGARNTAFHVYCRRLGIDPEKKKFQVELIL